MRRPPENGNSWIAIGIVAGFAVLLVIVAGSLKAKHKLGKPVLMNKVCYVWSDNHQTCTLAKGA